MRKIKFASFILLVVVLSQNLFAQSTGKIMGQVIDKTTGEGIPFANVYIESISTGGATDFDGNYVILNIPPDVYTLTASYIGYQKVTQTEVRVNVGFTTSIDFALPPGSFEMEAVIVEGERNPLIRQDLTNPTVAINSETLDILPVDNIADVIQLQAGVVKADDGNLHIRGGRSNEIAYQVNGLSINDPYGNSRSVGVATNAVQEVSVSTGTFSAEFGNALSGVVNYVTKEGGSNYSFSIRSYVGEYFSSRNDVFKNIDDIDLANRQRYEVTAGGRIPFLGETKFFVSGIFEDYKGLYNGRRLYNTTDSYLSADAFATSDERKGSSNDPYFFNPYSPTSNGLPTGDSSWVPMNPSINLNLQGNISHNFGSLIKLKYEAVYNKGHYKSFGTDERAYLFNPDGVATTYDEGVIQSLDLVHTLNNFTFYTLKASFSWNQSKKYLYEDFNDPRYLPGFYSRSIGTSLYNAGGTDNDITDRTTKTYTIKGDIVSQIYGVHEVKAGFEFRKHNLQRDSYGVTFYKGDSDVPISDSDVLYGTSEVTRRKYTYDDVFEKEPVQVAAYLQDKMELAKTLILNAGIRYEYFDAASDYSTNLSKNLDDQKVGNLDTYVEATEIKHMVSPRFSVSYPITDRGVIRFSYGHFYQLGSLSDLYRNPARRVEAGTNNPRFGNANVDPERSIQYELGLQQQLTEDFKFDLTGYYKDVRDYIYTQNVKTFDARSYRVLTNLSYANVKGMTLSFIKRRSPGGLFSATLDYTFQVAEGNRTEPDEDLFFSEAAGKQTETFLVPLDFDRSHLINGTVTLSEPRDWAVGIIYNLQTGSPYTPALPTSFSTITYEQTSANKPFQWNVDLKLEKFFKIEDFDISVFIQIENLFDTANERYVWANSGQALENAEEKLTGYIFNDLRRRIASDPGLFDSKYLDDYYAREERLSRPREVRIGFSLLFN